MNNRLTDQYTEHYDLIFNCFAVCNKNKDDIHKSDTQQYRLSTPLISNII